MKSYKFLLGIAVALCCLACQENNYPKQKDAIRLLQYNVGAFGKYMDNSTEMIAAMIRELDADIVSLNEVDSCNRRHDTFQCADLAQALGGWNYTYGRAMPYKGGAYGNGIVCKGEMVPGGTIALDKGEGSEPRCAVVAETPEYVFLAAHLDHVNEEACVNQAIQLTRAVKARYMDSGKAVFLAGDMNSRPDNIVITTLKQDWELLSITEESTAPCPKPRVCIDYIFALKNGVPCTVLGSAIPKDFKKADVEKASDHYPIYVDIILR